MTKYQKIVEQNLPRLLLRRTHITLGETQQDQYSWGFIGGGIPMSKLIGFIGRVQDERRTRRFEPAPAAELVIAYDPESEKMVWCCCPSIPVDDLCGALEFVKASLVASQLGRIAAATMEKMQTGLVDPTGNPILKT